MFKHLLSPRELRVPFQICTTSAVSDMAGMFINNISSLWFLKKISSQNVLQIGPINVIFRTKGGRVKPFRLQALLDQFTLIGAFIIERVM